MLIHYSEKEQLRGNPKEQVPSPAAEELRLCSIKRLLWRQALDESCKGKENWVVNTLRNGRSKERSDAVRQQNRNRYDKIAASINNLQAPP